MKAKTSKKRSSPTLARRRKTTKRRKAAVVSWSLDFRRIVKTLKGGLKDLERIGSDYKHSKK